MLTRVEGEAKKLSIWPGGNLSIFGLNTYNKPLWRVVWSETRQYMVGGAHTRYDQSAGGPSKDKIVLERGKDPNQLSVDACYKWKNLYPGKKCWILERWLTAYEFTGMSPAAYERAYRDAATGLLTLGPYPTEGDYDEAFIFPGGIFLGWSVVEAIIQDIEFGRKYSLSERVAAHNKALESEKKHNANLMESIFLNSQQAFKNRPSNVRPGKNKEIKLKYSAEELGLPRPHAGLSAGQHNAQPQRG